MSGAHVSPTLRRLVRQRAGCRCEYCGYPDTLISGSFHCDHFTPASAGGTSDATNLVWGCPACNASKHKRTVARDPTTKALVPLFDPRRLKWPQHFRWSADRLRIHGLTPTGRATVIALKLNRPHAVQVRRFLLQLNLHPATK